MTFSLEMCNASNGLWDTLRTNWRDECEALDEEFESYSTASMQVLSDLATSPSKHAGVFVMRDEGRLHAVFQANNAFLPKYDGRVLRIRHIIVSPEYDFGQLDEDAYRELLTGIFTSVVKLAKNGMLANHIKFHLRSPSDVYFFRSVWRELGQEQVFSSVEMRGAWLYLSF